MALTLHSATYTTNLGTVLANQSVTIRHRYLLGVSAPAYVDAFGSVVATPTTNGSGVLSVYMYPGEYSAAIGPYRFTISVPEGVPSDDGSLMRVEKLVTENVSTTTIQDDPELFLAVEANATYEFRAFVYAYAEALTDFRISFTAPAGSTMLWTSDSPGQSSLTPGDVPMDRLPRTVGEEVRVGATGAGTIMTPVGFFTTAGTAGFLRFQRAVWNAPAEDPEYFAGSWLQARRLS